MLSTDRSDTTWYMTDQRSAPADGHNSRLPACVRLHVPDSSTVSHSNYKCAPCDSGYRTALPAELLSEPPGHPAQMSPKDHYRYPASPEKSLPNNLDTKPFPFRYTRHLRQANTLRGRMQMLSFQIICNNPLNIIRMNQWH